MKTILLFTITATISLLFSGSSTLRKDTVSISYEDVWRRSGIKEYEYVLEYRTPNDYSRVRITVDPSVRFSQMTVLTGHIPPDVCALSTVQKLFGFVNGCPGSCRVTYDTEYGYPVEIERELENGEYCRIKVIGFQSR